MGIDDKRSEVQPDTSTRVSDPKNMSTLQPQSVQDLRQRSFQYMQDGFSIVDANGLHVDVNAAFCLMTGFSEEELIGYGPEHSYWPPEERDSIQHFLGKALHGEFAEIELVFMRKSGDRFPVLVNPFAINDDNGAVIFYATTVKDNTQRKKMEADLRQSEERYRALFENSSEAIIIIDGSTIIDCNQRTLDLFNLASRDQLKFRSDAEFFPPTQQNGQDSSEFARDKLNATYAGDTQSFEWTHVKLDGDTIHVEVNLSEVRLGEKSVIQANIRDITRRRKVEEALVDLNSTLEERVEERTDELEKAYAELLQKNVQFRELAKRLSHAEEQERRRIARLLHDNHQQLLVAAKIRVEMLQGDSYNSDVNNAAGQVLEILDQAVEVTRSLTMELAPPILYGSGLTVAMQWLARWMKEEHQLEVILQGSVPATRISTEMSHVLFRAVRELLFNVIKHSGVKQAHLKISLVDQQLLLTVVDEGAGFNVADTLESAVSYGLFSIEEQLVAFEGRLDISSTPKSGTTCTISIPISTAKALDSEDLQSGDNFVTDPTISLQARRGSIRIMVVDDHLVARSALVQILTLMEDFDVVGEAVDGLDAIEKARTLMPDVILMDVSMPRMDGVEATRAITTEMSGVKIIGLSMHSAEEMEPQMLAVGAMGYLQKHTPVETLLATVRSVMKNSGAATSAGHDG